MIIVSEAVQALAADDAAYPVIGYDNIVTVDNITADTADANYPVTNLANPATNQRWQGATATEQTITVTPGSAEEVDYIAIAEHNLSSGNIGLTVEAYGYPDRYTKSLLHFDGVDASTTFTDETGKVWTPAGNAQIDTSQSKFGGASGLFDGTGDYISTPDHVDLELAALDFTIECMFKCAAPTGLQSRIFGKNDSAGTVATASFWAYRHESLDVMVVNVFHSAGSTVSLVGTTQFTNLLNTGWHHMAVVRVGTSLRLYIDGVLEDSDTLSGTINNNSNALTIGRLGEAVSATQEWIGWIDEFRLSVGIARYTATFTPPTAPFAVEILDPYGSPQDSFTKVFLRCEGPDGSTTFKDEVGTIWTAANGAVIDSDAPGGTAAFFPFAADNKVTRADGADITLGSSNFTIEAWFNLNNPAPGFACIAAHADSTFALATSSWGLYTLPSVNGGTLFFRYCVGGSEFGLNSDSQFSSVFNAGWHHVAITRSGSTFRMFIDGVLEDSHTNAVTINDAATVMTMGGNSGQSGLEWWGWIDDLKLRIGVADYTAAFTPTPRSFRVPASDGPLIYQFLPSVTSRVRIRLLAGDEVPRIAVLYVGKLLVLERSVRIDTPHTPINMGRKSDISTGRSENGKFLGRTVLGQWNESQADFAFFTSEWYRTYFQPFVDATDEIPFFFAWSPQDHPEDTGYVWMTEDPRDEINTVVDRPAISIKYQGIVSSE